MIKQFYLLSPCLSWESHPNDSSLNLHHPGWHCLHVLASHLTCPCQELHELELDPTSDPCPQCQASRTLEPPCQESPPRLVFLEWHRLRLVWQNPQPGRMMMLVSWQFWLESPLFDPSGHVS